MRKWRIVAEGRAVDLVQNPSGTDIELEKRVSYEEVIDGDDVRLSPPNGASENRSFEWKACNARQREFLKDIAKRDLRVKIVSHHGDSEIIPIGSNSSKQHSLAGWDGYFDDYAEVEVEKFSDLYYEISVKMGRVKELDLNAIKSILAMPAG